MPLGYECKIFERDPVPGGLMRTNIPSFRLPEEVLNEECDRIINMGVEVQYNKEIKSLKEFLKEDFDAVFVGTGAPKGKDLNIPGQVYLDLFLLALLFQQKLHQSLPLKILLDF